MLNFEKTRIVNGGLKTFDVLPTEIGKIEGGHALVRVWSNGKAYVKRSAGVANEDYVGVARGPNRGIGSDAIYRNVPFTIAAGNLVATLGNDLATGVQATDVPTVYVEASNGVRTMFAADDAAEAGKFVVTSLAPLTLTFHADDIGKTVRISFNAKPTIDDVLALGISTLEKTGLPEDIDGSMVVVVGATSLVTDKFDSSVDWMAGGVLKTAAGGYFTLGGDGTAIDGTAVAGFSRLLAAPDADGLTITVNV